MKLKIEKAILKAKEQGRGITRELWSPRATWIIPTNTNLCMILMQGEHMFSRWNPSSDDLTANDWMVYG